MDISYSYKKVGSKDEAYEKVKSEITPEYVEKFKVKADIDYNDSDKTIKAKGKGFGLDIIFKEDKVELGLDLSFLLKPLKSKILESFERKIEKLL